jgi:hypothetical protein
MNYPGDIYRVIVSIIKADGTNPNVTSAPVVTIINLADSSVVVNGQAMTLLASTQKIYTYAWNTNGLSDGEYLAFVSYASDGITVNGRFQEKIHLGDSRILGTAALDSTVAKDATVAKDVTVAKSTDIQSVNPNNSTAVLAIKAKTDALPTNVASQDTLATVLALLTDVNDCISGSWIVDKTANPKTLTFRRGDNSVIHTYTITEDNNQASRTKTS